MKIINEEAKVEVGEASSHRGQGKPSPESKMARMDTEQLTEQYSDKEELRKTEEKSDLFHQ